MGISGRYDWNNTHQPLGRFGPTFGQESPDEETVSESPLDDLSREEPGGIGYKILHQGYLIWWSITVLGLSLPSFS